MRTCSTCGMAERLESPFIEGQCEKCIRAGSPGKHAPAPRPPQPPQYGVKRTMFDAKDLLIVAGFLVATLIAVAVVFGATKDVDGMQMPGLLAIVFINALMGGLLAQTIRGRFAAGLIVSGLLGCIGHFVILIFQDHRRKCPHCFSTIVPQASVCARCGRETVVA